MAEMGYAVEVMKDINKYQQKYLHLAKRVNDIVLEEYEEYTMPEKEVVIKVQNENRETIKNSREYYGSVGNDLDSFLTSVMQLMDMQNSIRCGLMKEFGRLEKNIEEPSGDD